MLLPNCNARLLASCNWEAKKKPLNELNQNLSGIIFYGLTDFIGWNVIAVISKWILNFLRNNLKACQCVKYNARESNAQPMNL